jgi:hypothetical protein
MFVSRELVNSGIIVMGNGTHCRITGISNIRIKMFDDAVRKLCDVRHVPKVEKNLISLSTIDSNSYGYKSKGGVMKVTKGAMVVMKGAEKFKKYL